MPDRWPPHRAQDWYTGQPWRVGCNFIPSTAINQLEMWGADTFDPETIEREFGWAAGVGFNAARVFLHDLLWADDRTGLLERIDAYLRVAARNGIGTMFVLFDGVWNPHSTLGPQPQPRPRLHNSGWVQSPGAELLGAPAGWDVLKDYVQGVVSAFKDDDRVFVWDLFNEPDNPNAGTYHDRELPDKEDKAIALLRETFAWAREVAPSQPLTAGIWRGRLRGEGALPITDLMLGESDVLSFHSYLGDERVENRIEELEAEGRPIFLTEFLARGFGSTFEGILPVAKRHKVGAFCWGLVAGKTQTIYPWDSWVRPYETETDPWFHDVFRADGTPYSESEAAFLRDITRVS
jgi:hypothetical protein